MGSASELDYHLLLARDVGYLREADRHRLMDLLSELRRMLPGFIKQLTDS